MRLIRAAKRPGLVWLGNQERISAVPTGDRRAHRARAHWGRTPSHVGKGTARRATEQKYTFEYIHTRPHTQSNTSHVCFAPSQKVPLPKRERGKTKGGRRDLRLYVVDLEVIRPWTSSGLHVVQVRHRRLLPCNTLNTCKH